MCLGVQYSQPFGISADLEGFPIKMVFRPPSWTPQLPEVPDTVPVCEFVLDERYGRRPFSESRDSYVCGLTGRSIGPEQQRRQVDRLARSLSRELGWKVNQGTEYDKVACIFAYNTVRHCHCHYFFG